MTQTVFDLQQMTLAELEKWSIKNAMRRNNHNIKAVARQLKIGRTTLYRKLNQYAEQDKARCAR
jgi:transcriptional regulator with PAS, ATPase and Fis domain